MKSLKAKILCASILFLSFSNVFAQKDEKKTETKKLSTEERLLKKAELQEKLITAQIGEINKRLNLDDATAAKFDKSYREYVAELNAYRDETRKNMVRRSKDMSSEDADKFIQQRFERNKKTIEIRENHYKQLKTILTSQQIVMMYDVENDMQRKIERAHHQRFNKNTKKSSEKKK